MGLVDPIGQLVRCAGGRGEPVSTDRGDRDGITLMVARDDADLVVVDEVVEEVLDLTEQLRQPGREEGEFGGEVVKIRDVDGAFGRESGAEGVRSTRFDVLPMVSVVQLVQYGAEPPNDA